MGAEASMYESPTLDTLPHDSLRKLHRAAIEGPAVRDLLGRAQAARVVLDNGVDRRSEPRTARILAVHDDRLELDAPRLSAGRPQIYLHFDLEAVRYFFAAPPLAGGGREPLALALPKAIYEAERRDLRREPFPEGDGAPRVRLRNGQGPPVEGRLRDWSYQGMAVALPVSAGQTLGDPLEVEVLDGAHAVGTHSASLFSWSAHPARLRKLDRPRDQPGHADQDFPVDSRRQVLAGCALRHACRPLAIGGPSPTDGSATGPDVRRRRSGLTGAAMRTVEASVPDPRDFKRPTPAQRIRRPAAELLLTRVNVVTAKLQRARHRLNRTLPTGFKMAPLAHHRDRIHYVPPLSVFRTGRRSHLASQLLSLRPERRLGGVTSARHRNRRLDGYRPEARTS